MNYLKNNVYNYEYREAILSIKQNNTNREVTKKIIVGFLAVAMITCLLSLLLLLFDATDTASAVSIKQGMTGTTVKTIQTKLKNWGYYSGEIDGIFGANTTDAVKSFQRKNGLKVDGIVGTATAKSMGVSLASDSSSGASANSNDTYLLARCVYGEARGEPYVGQVAVAAVALNRVRNAEFPNSIAGVIYQPWAFTCVNDGQINLAPNDAALRAAKDALSGWDPTNGCLYYYNPATATNAWIKQRDIHLTIGRHVFCL
ncbi:MAG: spore cortex-lytic enzyme [Christensenellaceae bacterium]|jgi:N-acetylmuramoyl-L-alanine amidase|nr:spore cortex-lytic enzyme [Christensenellaceae bacterium]